MGAHGRDTLRHERHGVGEGSEGPAVRRMVMVAMAACLLVSCSTTEDPTRESGPDQTASASPAPGETASGFPSPAVRPHRPAGELPTVPATDSAATLARQLDRAATTLRTRDPGSTAARIAAEFHQVAVSLLVVTPVAFRRKVTALLGRHAARVTRSDVRAATLLRSLGEPQQQLPRWRIVEPPPAT